MALGIGLYYISLLLSVKDSKIKNNYIKVISKYLESISKKTVNIEEELKLQNPNNLQLAEEMKNTLIKHALNSND